MNCRLKAIYDYNNDLKKIIFLSKVLVVSAHMREEYNKGNMRDQPISEVL